MKKQKITFVCNTRCFHTMDWYRAVQSVAPDTKITLLTDLIDSESHKVLINDSDNVVNLFNIDFLLFKKQFSFGDKWRNLIKLFFIPIQVIYLKLYSSKNIDSVYHAITMYYIIICWLAKINYIATPQGSEILVRSKRSYLYRLFTVKALQAATVVTVDSVEMKNAIFEITRIEAEIVQNGVDISAINDVLKNKVSTAKDIILSIRGMAELYRVDKIIENRNYKSKNQTITFMYPFLEESYFIKCKQLANPNDIFLGRCDKNIMYEYLASSKLVISIPKSDASPRSVYEAIFCGAAVACVYGEWMEMLTECMKQRIYIVDLNNQDWFSNALNFADNLKLHKYVPSLVAIKRFDQNHSMNRMISEFY